MYKSNALHRLLPIFFYLFTIQLGFGIQLCEFVYMYRPFSSDIPTSRLKEAQKKYEFMREFSLENRRKRNPKPEESRLNGGRKEKVSRVEAS